MMKLILIAATLHLIQLSSFAQYVDETFEVKIRDYPSVYRSALQSDGKVLLSGSINYLNDIPGGPLFRINADGSTDTEFYPPNDLIGDTPVNNIVTYGDSLIIVSAEGEGWMLNQDGSICLSTLDIAKYGSTVVNAIKTNDGFLLVEFGDGMVKTNKYNLNGEIDESFNEISTNGRPIDAAILSDGKILLVGEFSVLNGISVGYIARLNSNGTIDQSFNPGDGADSYIKRIEIDNNDNIYISGPFNNFDGIATSGITKLNSSGGIDPIFNLSTFSSYNPCLYHTLDKSNGLLYAAFYNSRGTSLLKCNLDGDNDEAFNVTGQNISSSAFARIHLLDTAILYTGSFGRLNGQDINGVSIINPAGEFVSGYNPTAESIPNIEQVDRTDGKIILSGDFYKVNGKIRSSIVRLNADGTIDNDFNTPFESENIDFVKPLSNGKILVIGNGINTTMLNNDGSIDGTFAILPGSINTFMELNEGSILLGGSFSSIQGSEVQSLAIVEPDGQLNQAFNPDNLFESKGTSFNIFSLDTLQNGNIVIGGYDYGVGAGFLKIINNDATSELYSDDTYNELINTINTSISDRVVYGGFYSNSPNYVRQISFDGTSVGGTIQVTSNDSNINEIIIHNGDLIVGGRFTEINEVEKNGIAKVALTGSVDQNFQLEFGGVERFEVTRILKKNTDTAYVSGFFSQINQSSIGGFSRVILKDGIPQLENLISQLSFSEDETLEFLLDQFQYKAYGNNPNEIAITVSEGANYTVDENVIIPDQNFYGTLDVEVTLEAEGGSSEPLQFQVEVNPVNDAPVILSQIEVPIIRKGMTYDISPSLFEISDVDNEDGFEVVVSEGSKYTSSGTILTPDPSFIGNLIVPITITDGELESEVFEAEFAVEEPLYISLSNGLLIRPNPFHNDLFIEVPQDFVGGLLKVFDLSGKVHIQMQNANKEMTIRLGELKNGIYLIELSHNDEILRKKVVKK